MTRMPTLKPREVIAILEKAGYYIEPIPQEVIALCVTLTALSASQFPITLKTSKEVFYAQYLNSLD